MPIRISLILCLWLSSLAPAGALVKYVDPDAVGTGSGDDWTNAYTTLDACESLNWNLTDAGGDTLTVWCRSSAGTVDTTPVQWANWTTSETCDIKIRSYDGTYILRNNNEATATIMMQSSWMTLDGLRIEVVASTSDRFGIQVTNLTTPSKIYNCTVVGTCSGTGTARGIRIDYGTNYIANTVVVGFVSGANTGFSGIMHNVGTATYIWNCTIWGNYYGIHGNSSVHAVNCIVANNNDDIKSWTGTVDVDYCATDDGDGDFPIAPFGANWANEFATPGSDFHLLTGGNCYEAGVTDPGGANQPDTDIEGNYRAVPWNVGAYESDPLPGPTVRPELIVIPEE
jgi:hypothetical protein